MIPMLILAALLALPAAGASGHASAVVSGNGKIAFANGASELDVINPDGSGQRRLAGCVVANCVIGGYAWSPNGKYVAFLRGVDTKMWLYVVDA